MNSITEFIKNGIPKIEGIVNLFYQDVSKEAEFEDELEDVVKKFVCDVMSEAYTNVNTVIKDSNERKRDWNVVKTEDKKLLSRFGEFSYKSTTFVNKQTCKHASLVNQYLGISPHERLTERVKEHILQEAVQSNYHRAGEECSYQNTLSKEAVMNYLHSLKFPEHPMWPEKKRVAKTLFIEADEDHCKLQYQAKKGDLTKNENNRKDNCVLTKIVYVHEGITRRECVTKEGEWQKRHELKNPYYFSGLYEGKDNEKLWRKVYDYISHVYDLNQVEHIYLMSDGGGWIRAGRDLLCDVTHVLDEFHVKKYLLKMTRHMLDSAEDARKEICEIIRDETRERFEEETAKLLTYTKTDTERRHVEEGASYILNNWSAAKIRLAGRKYVVGCSAECHVSHVLADRMTSRPMGWSRTGADKMAHLRAYYYNQGDMRKLVRMQKKELSLASGAENIICSCRDILNSESNKSYSRREQELRKYYDTMQASVSVQDRKIAYFGGHVVLF